MSEDLILIDARQLRPALRFLRALDRDAATVLLLLMSATQGRRLDVGEQARQLGFTDREYRRALDRLERVGALEVQKEPEGGSTIKARADLRIGALPP